MIECNDLFDYDFKIYQNPMYFKFSLDSILLAEFVKLKNNMTILDMCTGNAPVPLILLSKNKTITVDAVEIQPEIYELAKKSIEHNKLENNVHLINGDIKTVDLNKKYDIVTCNPPYFKNIDTSYKNDNNIKRGARHEIFINLEQIISIASRNLKENGTFFMVHRVDRFLDCISLMNKYKFGIRDVCFIYTKDNEKAEFCLIEASKCKKSDIKVYSKYVKNLKTYKGIFEE